MANHPRAALITGATSGIGRELANCFAKDHYNLVIVARNQRELEQTASELRHQYGVQVLPIAKDLFHPDAPFEVYDEIRDRGIRIDALVNNAGQGQYGQFTTTDINREARHHSAQYWGLRHFHQALPARHGGPQRWYDSAGVEHRW
ncbi:SDR family NAD(P)-dependent oxidoreductase [Hymenobacter humi]|uniref:SDR family NAD(P)-dependent oxidoreductase n=1 Tax=Hymenobacter humi TaxID=1411620 RepID=A0ABW2U933_9BACT